MDFFSLLGELYFLLHRAKLSQVGEFPLFVRECPACWNLEQVENTAYLLTFYLVLKKIPICRPKIFPRRWDVSIYLLWYNTSFIKPTAKIFDLISNEQWHKVVHQFAKSHVQWLSKESGGLGDQRKFIRITRKLMTCLYRIQFKARTFSKNAKRLTERVNRNGAV